jgi:hypothetical protein
MLLSPGVASSFVASSLLVMQSICQLDFVQIPYLMFLDAANLPQIRRDTRKAHATDLPCGSTTIGACRRSEHQLHTFRAGSEGRLRRSACGTE